MAVKLAEHQLEAVSKLSNGKILCGGVGTGKSTTAIAYFFTRECGGELKENGEFGEMRTPKDQVLHGFIFSTARVYSGDSEHGYVITSVRRLKNKMYKIYRK